MKNKAAIVLCLPLLVWCIMRFYNYIAYKIVCGSHLKIAALTESLEEAKGELTTVIQYLEDNDMT
jgi:hypothetical protein